MKKIAVLASGISRGSNFNAICQSITQNNYPIQISFLFVTDKTSPITQIADKYNIPIISYNHNLKINDQLIKELLSNPVDLIVLAGFMRKLNNNFFELINTPVINIHPSLLPKYGGKGMFGIAVHKAVYDNKEKISGATVHYVNEKYDEGTIVYQKECDIADCTSPEDIADKVIKIEHCIYIKAITKLLL
ncbi:MAG: phosphoribosylglycinamide formyltransferase [Candidatus Cloacimonetes bacterium]|nr:phosphoribosylglycinamide formyltransferase [Candidatus Cloacimonadota bacterium]